MPAVRVMSQSRAVPVGLDDAFAGTLAAPLPVVFRRWFGLVAPVAEVRDAEPTWERVGQTRTIVQALGAGSFHEALTEVDPPRRFAYHLDDVTGPVSAMIATVDGAFTFRPAGTGTEITWEWRVVPPSAAGAVLLAGFEPMWHGYARQALEQISDLLLA